VACGGPSKPPTPIGNQTPTTQAVPADSKARIVGKITSTTGEPLAGVTIVFMPASSEKRSEDDELVLVTKADGTYSIEVPADTYELTFYYADMTWRRHSIVVTGTSTTTVDQQFDDTSRAGAGEIQECFTALASSCHVIH